MAAPISTLQHVTHVRVDLLTAGDRIVYDGAEWVVCEVLPVRQPGGWSVIGRHAATGVRETLLFSNRSASAGVLS